VCAANSNIEKGALAGRGAQPVLYKIIPNLSWGGWDNRNSAIGKVLIQIERG
jgi:hypothetical protein